MCLLNFKVAVVLKALRSLLSYFDDCLLYLCCVLTAIECVGDVKQKSAQFSIKVGSDLNDNLPIN